MSIAIKRVYDAPSAQDGERVLVDRLWPRGVSKERAALSLWMKEIGPSTELRTWFDHRADRMDVFAARYRQELDTQPDKQQDVARLLDMAKHGTLTLLYGAKDPVINQAHVLRDYLEDKLHAQA